MLTLYIADAERDVGMKNLSRKEALEILDDMKVKIEIPKAAVMQYKRNAALDMAIEALKYSEIPNSSNDCISRQAAIELIERMKPYHQDADDIAEMIANVPTAQPKHIADDERKIADLHKMVNYLLSQLEQRWIPVTEKLPEDEYVLISKKPTKLSGSKWCVTVAIRMADPRSGKIQWRDSGFGVIQDDEVLAWMPRPKPYKGDDTE